MSNNEQVTEKSQGSENPDILRKPEVAKRLKVSVRTVDNWMAAGILPYYKVRRTVFFHWSEVQATYQANNRVCLRGGGINGQSIIS